MNIVSLLRGQLLLLLPLFVLGTVILISSGGLITKHPEVAVGITYDLAVLLPVLYFFAIRKKKISNFTTVPVFVFGLLLSKYLLPNSLHFHANLIHLYVLPIVEIVVVSIVGYKIYKARSIYKTSRESSLDFHQAIYESALNITGSERAAHFISTDIGVVVYSFFIWRKPKLSKNEFTVYKESGNVAVFGGLILLLLVEGAGIHLLIEHYSPIIAWIFTISSVYFLIQALGHIKAMKRRYARVSEGMLVINYGVFGKAIIDIDAIERIELLKFDFKPKDNAIVQRLNLLGEVESTNVALYLKKVTTIEKMFGRKKQCNVLLVHIDEAKRLKNLLNI